MTTSPPELPQILIVDDELGIREAYQHYLAPTARPRGVRSHRLARNSPAPETVIANLLLASSGEEAVELVARELDAGRRVHAGFFDMKMPGGIDGLETLRRILELDAELMCIVVTAYTDQPLDDIRALFGPGRQDDWDYLNKPFSANEVVQKARNALSSWWRRRRDEAQASVLEAQIAERTRRLSDANVELERSHAAMANVLAELQSANDRLRVEMAERARLEEERRLSSKLEGIGQLAAGIAHEINTPTQYILSNAEMLELALRDMLPEIAAIAETSARCAIDHEVRTRAARVRDELPALEGELEDAVGAVVRGATSIARIVGAMRDFARVDPPEMRPADLNQAVRATLEVVRHEYRHVADVELELGALPMVRCHVGEVQQVLVNLIVNAAHAIGGREDVATPGRIHIASRHDTVRGSVEIEVADNGVGIKLGDRERIFDPFFTTKAAGKGTGQGLAIARTVIMRHHGTLDFDTALGSGTRFLVRLPVDGPRDQP